MREGEKKLFASSTSLSCLLDFYAHCLPILYCITRVFRLITKIRFQFFAQLIIVYLSQAFLFVLFFYCCCFLFWRGGSLINVSRWLLNYRVVFNKPSITWLSHFEHRFLYLTMETSFHCPVWSLLKSWIRIDMYLGIQKLPGSCHFEISLKSETCRFEIGAPV